ncbi:MAG: GGDEF domain-containing protein [Nitrospiraceae bacterium]|nr:MAG: GGDEF domain-containing protein [Nitrospiraceae bacterium]
MDLNEDYYKKVLDNLYDGIYFIDQGMKIIYWNKGAENHTGYTHADVIGKNCWKNILMCVNEEGIKLCSGSCPISQTAADGCLREVDVYIHHKEGHLIPVSMRIAPIRDLAMQVVVAVEIYNESSPKFTLHQKIEELKKLTLVDPLTELGNRQYIEINLKGKLEELKRYDWSVGVLFIDIDNFKEINDNYGHNTGDQALKIVGRTMLNTLRTFDIIGRWGGEEFVAVIVNVDDEKLATVAERLRRLVERSGISRNSDRLGVTVSIGGTLARKDDTIDTVIKRADKLMYKSKASGRNCISIDTRVKVNMSG